MITLPTLHQRVFYAQLPTSSTAYVITEAAKQHTQAPLLVLTTSAQEAFALEQACQFFAPEIPCFVFPSWETLAYDQFSPHESIVSERLLTLRRLPHLKQAIVIAQISTVLQRLAPVDYMAAHVFSLKVGERIDREYLRTQLQTAGYHCVSQVSLPGEYATRGSIFDIFPTGTKHPFRLDLFDNDIESIKSFDVETQRSFEDLSAIELLPAHEFPINEEGIQHFREHFRENFSVKPTDCPVYQAVSQGETPPGIEYFLPLFFSHTATFFDYLPKHTILVTPSQLRVSAEHDWTNIRERYQQLAHDIYRPILPPAQLFLSVDELTSQLQHFAQWEWVNPSEANKTQQNHLVHPPFESLPDILIQPNAPKALAKFLDFLSNVSAPVLLCAESAGRREHLLSLIKPLCPEIKSYENWEVFKTELDKNNFLLGICIANLQEGFISTDKKEFIIIPEAALLGTQPTQKNRRNSKHFDTELMIRNLAELMIGDPIVHIDHGVGRYQGLEILTVGGQEGEFLKLHYDGGNLYVPVSNLNLISRYNGSDTEHAPLHRLGSDQWEKAKRKAVEQVRDVAAELLNTYAARAAREGFQHKAPDEHYFQFAAGFPFEETPDQTTAIDAVIQDMTSPKPMDRLICGDVGFGKTEVAMRAAFLAVQSGKQVAILVPTTLLAQQHYESFKDRFAAWPIRVDFLSRFRTAKEQKDVLEKVANGSIDILIGTHKLLQNDVRFLDLGLLVLDEEHRFGVRQKEALKRWRTHVDVLTMTATPIPRTLNMAMADVRDLSIIATPPAKRLAIKTFIREFDWPVIREAIMRETLRGGQVYFLHNEVSTIENMAHELRELLPDARIAVGHGQMHERQLEKVMADFYHHRFNVLVCSTIIETGIDVPNANTIIINRADKFGLAQLHQLRGRVGRSHHQAYAYLFTPPLKNLSSDAQKRLEAIGELEELGVGFILATHDLEIRGAGELLGEQQSGNMHDIGYTLYMELLNRTVKAMQEGKLPSENFANAFDSEDCQLELQIPAFIPDHYLPDVNLRLVFYKRIASAPNQASIDDIKIELIDRFGVLPDATKNLFEQMKLKFQAEALGIKRIEANARGGRLEFTDQPKVDSGKIIRLIQLQPDAYKLEGPKKLRFVWKEEVEPNERLVRITTLLEKIVG